MLNRYLLICWKCRMVWTAVRKVDALDLQRIHRKRSHRNSTAVQLTVYAIEDLQHTGPIPDLTPTD